MSKYKAWTLKEGDDGIDKCLEQGEFSAQSAIVFGWIVDYKS